MKISLMSSIQSVHKVNTLWSVAWLQRMPAAWKWSPHHNVVLFCIDSCSRTRGFGMILLCLSSRLSSTLLTLYQTAGFPWIYSTEILHNPFGESKLCLWSQLPFRLLILLLSFLRCRDKCQWTPTSWECKVQISATPVLLPKSSQCIQKLRW